ncbi:MAG: MMPL family transporter, partial [Actinomycetota bacterium]|nr:MMPL family transporter [Actinomycetota bacterium]
MLDRLLLAVTRRVSRRPRLTIALALAAVLAAGALGGGVIDRLATGGFDDPASESSRGARVLEEQFAAGPSDVVLVVSTVDGAAGSVDDPAVVAAGLELTARLAADPALRDVLSYWT